MSTTRTSPRAPSQEGDWPGVAFTLTAISVGIAGFIGATHITFSGLQQTLHFFGESATPAEIVDGRRLFGLAAAIAAGVPLIGLLLSVWAHRRGLLVYFVILLVFAARSPAWSLSMPLALTSRSRSTEVRAYVRSTAEATTVAPAAEHLLAQALHCWHPSSGRNPVQVRDGPATVSQPLA